MKNLIMMVFALLASPSWSVQIFVLSIDNRTKTFEVDVTDSVLSLKEKVFRKTQIPLNFQRLIYAGKQLEDSKTLSEYDIGKHATLHLFLRPRG